MKELALLFKVFDIFNHVYILGDHPCLLIPEINKLRTRHELQGQE